MAVPDGLSALCGSVQPECLGHHLRRGGRAHELASASGRAAGSAPHHRRVLEGDLAAGEAGRQRLHHGRVLRVAGEQRDPAGHRDGGHDGTPASAIIVAGSPLSHEATPSTPRQVGSERISRRITIAASLRYGSESSIPAVPLVRPSHGSLTAAANGIAPSEDISRAAASTSRPISQWPVW